MTDSRLDSKPQQQRRQFLGLVLTGGACAVALTSPLSAMAAFTPTHAERTLKLQNVHTGNRLRIIYQKEGQNVKSNLQRLNFFLRDHRQNEATLMDPRLFDQLWKIQLSLGGDTTFEIISAYRSPKTNAMLRAKSDNVARNSYHIQGRALDIRVPHASTRKLRQRALSLQAGGVGYYPNSDFVHIDTGPVRQWRA